MRSPRDMSRHGRYMRRAVELARRGAGWVTPNPMVGALVVRGDEIVGEGYHRSAGEPHAEIHALRAARSRGVDLSAPDVTLYSTLEPCVHQGRTPPCVDAIVEAGMSRVVVGTRDPNPVVDGRGIAALRQAGIDVLVGVERALCEDLIEIFAVNKNAGRSHVTMKAAVSVDGRMATATGDSKWLSSAASRRHAHELRAVVDGVVVGSGTLRRDDPRLTVRDAPLRRRQPRAIVFSGTLDLPGDAALWDRPGTIVVTSREAAAGAGAERLRRRDVTLLAVPAGDRGWPRIDAALEELYRLGLCSLLVEGGGTLHGSFLRAGLVDRMVLYVTPVILGSEGQPLCRFEGWATVGEALRLDLRQWCRLEGDIVLEYVPTGRAVHSPRPTQKEAASGEEPVCLQD